MSQYYMKTMSVGKKLYNINLKKGCYGKQQNIEVQMHHYLMNQENFSQLAFTLSYENSRPILFTFYTCTHHILSTLYYT